MIEWTKRWNYWMAPTPSRPGIYKLRDGGFYIRARVTNPKTNKREEVLRALPTSTLLEAQTARDELLSERADDLTGNRPQRQSFATFALSLFRAKVEARDIKSAKGREQWEGILRVHLLPHFGEMRCDKIRAWDVKTWRDKLAHMIAEGYVSTKTLRSGKTVERRIEHLGPETANTWIRKARTIFTAMRIQLELPRDPGAVLDLFDTSQAPTYTDEDPNSLTTEKTRAFLAVVRRLHPQHYAMALLGFATGKRPSTLRPLRATGDDRDVDWDEGFVRFRRSHTRGNEMMQGTKTGTTERVHLPPFVMDALAEHRAMLADPPRSANGKPPLWWHKAMAESALLFPGRNGRARSPSALDKLFAEVSREIGIPYAVTPRAMRRTFNDLARDAKVSDVVTESITGHVDPRMRKHYSTAQAAEQRKAIGDVVDLVAYRKGGGGG